MALFTVFTDNILTLWMGMRTNDTFWDLALILWMLWMIISSIWMPITTMLAVIHNMLQGITTTYQTSDLGFRLWSLWITITTSNDPLDLVFKVWLSVMMCVLIRMATKCFRDLQLQHIHSQQEINNLQSGLTNMQHGFNADMDRFSDLLKTQSRVTRERYDRLLAMLQENRNSLDARFRAEELRTIFKKLKKQKDSALKVLNGWADDLDLHFSRIKKAKIAGSAASISGGVLVVVGLGLIPVSFGISSILSIVGSVISGAGGITVGGSSIVDTVLSSKKRDDVIKILHDYNTTMDEVKELCIEIGKTLNSSNNLATEYKTWFSFWSKLALGVTATSVGSWSAIVNPIMKSLRLASVGDDVAAAGFRGISVAGRAFTIAGSVVGILLLPLDIYTLVDSSIDVHKKNPHQVSKKIREICHKINADFPTDEEIEQMIHDTFSRRPILEREAYNQMVMQSQDVSYIHTLSFTPAQ